MSATDKARKLIATAIMVGLVGGGISAVTAIQQPDADGVIVYSLTFIIFSNGLLIWLVLGLIRKERLGRLAYTIGDLILGPIDDIMPTLFTPKTTGTLGAMILVTGFISVFVSGVLDIEALSFLGSIYNIATRGLTLVYWMPLQYMWEGAPVTLEILLEANHQGAGSLAAAAAVLLGELIDAVGIDNPSDLI